MGEFEDAFWANVDRKGSGDCWPWMGKRAGGRYGRFRNQAATHIALELDGRPRPDGLFALHACDNPPCVNPAHLRWGTLLQNSADCKQRGRLDKRTHENNPRARLTLEQVAEIRAGTLGYKATAKQYGVSSSAIRDIRRGWTWQ